MTYVAAPDRYDASPFRRCGRSGLLLPAISLGLWQNFGEERPLELSKAIIRRAFDRGITHFDLANNYGPPYGSAERVFGRALKDDLAPYRDELIISTKAGYDMWPGPYGAWGSTTSTSSTPTATTRTRRSRRRWARWTPPSARARRCTPAYPPTPARA